MSKNTFQNEQWLKSLPEFLDLYALSDAARRRRDLSDLHGDVEKDMDHFLMQPGNYAQQAAERKYQS